ncbi:MAG: DUF2497 domain-containing protein [Alphaproteobacteria bacterium]
MQEQEPSVNDILTSIRQILSDKIGEETQASIPEKKDIFQLEKELTGEVKPAVVPSVDLSMAQDVFYLTDAMRIREEPVGAAEKADAVTSSVESGGEFFSPNQKLPITQADIQPLVRAWLDENLRPITERIVTEEVRRIFNKH